MTTLAVVTLADGDTDLFPFWLEHYRSLGVDHIAVCVDKPGCLGISFRPEDKTYVHTYDVGPRATGEQRDEQERQAILNLAMLDRFVPDWILYTDLDEHQEYKPARRGGMQMALAAADARGEDVVMGVFADRVAADGSFPNLPAIEIGWDLGDCYPLRTNITRDLIGTRYTKIMAAKPGVVLRPGRHGTIDRPYAAKRAGALAAGHLVHHFKWRAGIIERIKRKMQDLPHPEYDWYRKRYGPFVEMVEANGGKIPQEWLK